MRFESNYLLLKYPHWIFIKLLYIKYYNFFSKSYDLKPCVLYVIQVFNILLIFISTTNPNFLFSLSVIHLYDYCIILSCDKLLFNNITISQLFNDIPKVNIFPAKIINPFLFYSFVYFSHYVIYYFISSTLSIFEFIFIIL